MLTIQFGQCGNQLGHSLFSQLSADLDAKDTGILKQANSDYVEQSFQKWFAGLNRDGKRLARAILVDTEHKVINKICSSSTDCWTYRSQSKICQSAGGSANNWAYGSLVKGPQLKEEILEKTRRELERTDSFDGILLLLSSAGGTGSGVGSFTADLLRQEFANKTIIGSIVLPFSSGEVGVQNYNTMLTLARFSECADLCLLFQNERIHAVCEKVLKNAETRLPDMNEVISRELCATFQPVNESWCNANYIASTLACQPSYRLASIKSTPYVSPTYSQYESACSWKLYLRNLKQSLNSSSLLDVEPKSPARSLTPRAAQSHYKSISNILLARGKVSDNDPLDCSEFKSPELYVEWLTSSESFTCLTQQRRLLGQDKFLALLTNGSHIYQSIDSVVDKAWTAYVNSAFIHQYKKFGLEEDDFLQSFAKMENIVANYKRLGL